MIAEVLANLSFRDLRKGDRIQVDIDDPLVAALVEAGYLTITWRAHGAVAHSAGLGGVPAAGVDSGDPGSEEPEQAELDGDDPDQPGGQDSAGA